MHFQGFVCRHEEGRSTKVRAVEQLMIDLIAGMEGEEILG